MDLEIARNVHNLIKEYDELISKRNRLDAVKEFKTLTFMGENGAEKKASFALGYEEYEAFISQCQSSIRAKFTNRILELEVEIKCI